MKADWKMGVAGTFEIALFGKGCVVAVCKARLHLLFECTCCASTVPGSAKADTSTIAAKVTEIAPGVFVHTGAHELFTPENSGDISNAGFNLAVKR